MGAPVVKADQLGRPIVAGPSGQTYILALNHSDDDCIGRIDHYLRWLRTQPENSYTRCDIDTLLDARNELTVEAHP